MSRSGEKFIEHYGGFRLGESEAELKIRMERIDELYALVKAGKGGMAAVEELRTLKGISEDD